MTMTATRPHLTGSEFRRYIDDHNALPDDVVLGHLAMFGVSDAAYDGTRMEAAFDRLGLNKKFLPRGLNPADAYEKASMVPDGYKYEVAGGHTAELLVREVTRDKDRIVRQLTREVKDGKDVRLLYGEVGEMVFYKPPTRNGVVDHSGANIRCAVAPGVSASEREIVVAQFKAFEDAYNRHCNFHDGQKVRGLVRSYLLHLNAIQMRPSVYFVHRDRAAEVHALEEFVNDLPPTLTSMTLVPLADLPKMRVDVTEAFQRESEEKFQKVLASITKLQETRKNGVSLEAYLKVRKEFDDALDSAGEHGRKFQVSQAVTAAASEIALNALNKLQEAVFQSTVGQAPDSAQGAA